MEEARHELEIAIKTKNEFKQMCCTEIMTRLHLKRPNTITDMIEELMYMEEVTRAFLITNTPETPIWRQTAHILIKVSLACFVLCLLVAFIY